MAELGSGPGGSLRRTSDESTGQGNGAGDGKAGDNNGNPQQPEQSPAHAEAYPTTPQPKEINNNGQGKPTGGPAEKTAPPAAGGASVSDGGTKLSLDGNSSQHKQETKAANASPGDKALSAPQQPVAGAIEKSNPAVSKSTDTNRNEAVKTHLPTAELTAVQPKSEQSIQPQAKSVEVTRSSQSLHDENKDRAVTSAQPDRNTTDSTQAKTNTASSARSDVPLGGPGREQKDSQAPPPVTKAQDNSSQNQNQNQKVTSYETKQEPKSGSIPPVIIPTDTHQTQKNQNPVSTAHQPERASVVSQKDLAAKAPDQNIRLGEMPGQHANGGKAASEAARGTNTDEPPKSPAAGELGSHNSAGREGRLVPEPNTTTDANVRGGTGKEFDVAHENTTRDALSDITKSQSQIGHTEQTAVSTSRLDSIDGVIEKHKENPLENPIVPIGRKDGKEPIVSQSEATRDPKVDNQSGKDKNADIANKADTRLPGNEVSSASMGAGFEGRSGRVDDKSEQKAETIERGETFKMLDGKPVKLDLSDKVTCKQLLDLINMIETNKFKPMDQTGRERLNLLLEIQPNSRSALKEMFQTFALKDKVVDLESVRVLTSDKLDSVLAKQFKDMADGRIDDAQKLQRLEAKVKDAGNFITSFASHVFEAFNRILGNARNSVNSSEAASVDDIYNEAHSEKMHTISVIEHTTSEQREQLLDKLAAQTAAMENTEINEDLEVEQTDDDTNANSKKIDPSGCSREEYLVQDKETPRSIARKCFNNEILWQLIWEINKPEATYSAVNDEIENRDFVAGERIYLPTYAERQKVLQPEEALHD